MDVKVRDALADFVVDRYEGTVRFHRLGYSAGQPLNCLEQGTDVWRGQVVESGEMLAGNQKRVPVEHGSAIEESDVSTVRVDGVGLDFTGDDPTEDAHGARR